ncbi:MAG: alpha/beta hydrolase fold domain-containing protein [Pseudorhodobacter sp.]|nr:alpha/beta hydrolase fold domain-containing protein [Pseudorhodobacter sp.]
MSLRLWILTWLMRLVVRPMLARATTPAVARCDLERVARLFRAPPYMLHLVGRDSTPPLHWISVGRPDDRTVMLYFHGGAYLAGSPATHAAMLGRLAKLTGLRVAAPAYRLAPEHPAPAAFEDACAAHGALMAQGYAPNRVVLGGDSAGGGLALALLADLCGRGLRPAGLFAFSPWTDMGLTGASLTENAALDPLLPASRITETVGHLRGDLPVTDPRISPLYASFTAPPPVWFQVGTTEILRDDSRRMAAHLRDAGGKATVTEWLGAPHVWQLFDGYIPEARAALMEVSGFVRAITL